MVLQSTGAISLADLQTEFGGANPIDFSEYYLNATTGYTSGVSGIPNIGSAISLNQFYTKAKEYMTAGNMGGNMSITGGTILSAITNVDDLATSIGPIGFPFFFFGTDYATANTIFWSTNQVLHFGTSRNNITWSATTGIGILLGNADRRTNSVYTFANTTVNGYNIKRLTIDHANSYSIAGSEIKMELRLIRGPIYQYIELRMNQWTAATAGTWNLTNGSTFLNIFSTAPPITTGKSLVLRSDLNGNNWTLYNQYYVNL
jgi:hypothetical protein